MNPLLTRARADAAAFAYVTVSLAGALTAKATFPEPGGGVSVRFRADGTVVVRQYRDSGKAQVRHYTSLADFVTAHREVA